MIPVLFCVICGLLLGSFLNVCITRLPRDESIVSPRSHCRTCQQQISDRDNIPLVGWVLLRGKCRACGSQIGLRYPAVELLISVVFIMCWFKFGLSPTAWTSALLSFLLIGLTVMDAETMLLPDSFTIPGLLLGMLIRGGQAVRQAGAWSLHAAVRGAAEALLDGIIAAALLLAVLGIYWLVRRRAGMGLGDVKLLAMLAAWLGLPQTALVFFFAVIAGAVYGLVAIAGRRLEKGVSAGSLPLPFGTFLSLAGLYSIFLGERTLRWYLQLFR